MEEFERNDKVKIPQSIVSKVSYNLYVWIVDLNPVNIRVWFSDSLVQKGYLLVTSF